MIHEHLHDPRVRGLVSVLRVDTSRDLRNARVYISVLGSVDDERGTLEGLQAASGFLRSELARDSSLRTVPNLDFLGDQSMAQGERMARMIDLLRDGAGP